MALPLIRKQLLPAGLLILVSFTAGFLLTPKALAQNCPSGSIGNCESLEILYEACVSGCSCQSEYSGGLCCYFVYYACYGPSHGGYSVRDCANPSCNF